MTASGLVIRAEAPRDRAAIYGVNARAFGRDNEARLVDALRATNAFIPDLSLVAERGGQVLGYVLFSRLAIDAASGAIAALALAPVAVEPDHQQRGIGSSLIRFGLDRAREHGHRVVIVLGRATYYSRFGFAPADHRGIAAPFPVSRESFMYLDLVAGASAEAAGTVRYPAAFGNV